VGDASAESFSSGVSKIIDEMDTSEERGKQVGYYQAAEHELWDLEAELDDYWRRTGQLNTTMIKGTWPKGAKVITNFAEQLPNVRRSEVVNTIRSEIDLGLEHRKGALRRLEPHMTDKEIEDKLKEVDEARVVVGEADEVDDQDTLETTPDTPIDDTAPKGSDTGGKQVAAINPDITLNGAQVTAMVDVVTAVTEGRIPRETGVQILIIAFNLEQSQAEKVIGSSGKGFKPTLPGEPVKPQKADKKDEVVEADK
jgi:hypothetical protein